MDQTGGTGPGTVDVEVSTSKMSKQPFRDLASSRIAGADDENSFHCNAGIGVSGLPAWILSNILYRNTMCKDRRMPLHRLVLRMKADLPLASQPPSP